MATHSSILALRIPWSEEPGGLLSMGCKKSDTIEHTHRQSRIVCVDFRFCQLYFGE